MTKIRFSFLLILFSLVGFGQCNMSASYFELPLELYHSDSVDIEFRAFDNSLLGNNQIDFIDNCWANDSKLIFVVKNNLFGLFDSTGKQITEIKYDYDPLLYVAQMSYFVPNPLKVKENGLFGLISHRGEEIMPCAFTSITDFGKGRFICKGEKTGLVDLLGNELLPFDYQEIIVIGTHDWKEMLNLKQHGKWAVFSEKFETIIPFEYDTPFNKVGNVLITTQNGKYGLLDLNGKLVAAFQYDTLFNYKSAEKTNFISFKPNYFSAIQNNKMGILDANGKEIVPLDYKEAAVVNNEYAKVQNGGLWALYSMKEGRQLTDFVFDDLINQYKSGLIHFEQGDVDGLVDKRGSIVLDKEEYKIWGDFKVSNKREQEFFVKIFDKNTKEGLIDSTGRIVIPPIYEEIWDEDYGFVGVRLKNKYGLIDPTTAEIVQKVELSSVEFENFKSRGLLRYQLDLKKTDFTFDTTYFANGQIEQIRSLKVGYLNGNLFEYDDFGQLMQTILYKDGEAVKSNSDKQASIAFEPSLMDPNSTIVSHDEVYLLAIPEDKTKGLFLYNIRDRKFIDNIIPDDDAFFSASIFNSFLKDSLLYMLAPGAKNEYKVLNLKSGKSSGFKIKESISSIVFMDKYDTHFKSIYTLDQGWVSTIFWYEEYRSGKNNKYFLDIYAFNYLTKDSLEITGIEVSKNPIFINDCLESDWNIPFFSPKNKIFIYQSSSLEAAESWKICSVENKTLKEKKTVYMLGQSNRDSSVMRTYMSFANYGLIEEYNYSTQSSQYTQLMYPKLKERVLELELSGDSKWSFLGKISRNETYQQATNISEGYLGLLDEKANKLSFYKYPLSFENGEAMSFLYKTQKLIGFTEKGLLATSNLQDTSIIVSGHFQNAISFVKYEANTLFLEGFSLHLPSGLFSKNEIKADSTMQNQHVEVDSGTLKATNLTLFETTTHKSLNSKRLISERTETNGSKLISFYNGNQAKYMNRHVFMRVFNDKDFLLYTPDGYYMGSLAIGNVIYFEQNKELHAFEQFDLKYNRPDIVLERLGYADSSLIAAYQAAYQKRLKKMGFTEDMLQDDFNIPELKIENFERMPTITDSSSIHIDLQLNDRKYPLDRINVWVNDVAIYGRNGISLREKNIQNHRISIPVRLIKGNNKVQVSVLNQVGAESFKESFDIECSAGKTRSDLYLITIGESEFIQKDFNLNYAAKDAKDIADLLATSKVYQQVYTKMLTNSEVTKENVLALAAFLEKADINDQVLIFIAGHGVLNHNLDYYFATYDVDFNQPSERGLAYEDLEGLLDGIAPLKKALIMDACHSGELDKEDITLASSTIEEGEAIKFRAVGFSVQPKLGTQNTTELIKSLFTDLRKGTGATVVSSAGGMEFAMEGADWNNGLFTYCLLNGIQSGAADLDKNGEIWLSELQKYLSKEVPLLSKGRQQPTSRIENQIMDFRVW